MTDREAMQMALDVLKQTRVFVTTREKIKHPEGTDWYDYTIEALRAALAQGEQEPVALHKLIAWIIDECHVYPESADEKAFAQRLLAAILHPKSGYTAPPQRTWIDPSSAEIKALWNATKKPSEFAALLLAKFKEKNS